MLTERLMVQALADRLAGLPTTITARQLSGYWAECWMAMDRAPEGANLVQVLTSSLVNHPERVKILEAILARKPGARPVFENLAELGLTLEPIQWLWPGWLPRGMLTIVGAAPGAGKSYLALDLAWRIINGGRFPDGQPVPVVGANVIYVDAEAVPQILHERALGYGVDTSKMYLMLPEDGQVLDLGDQVYRERLVEMCATLAPELVIIDSLSSIHRNGQNNVEDVRELLVFLAQLAGAFRVSLLLVHHIRKPSGGTQMQLFDLDMGDLSGSAHIVAMARVIWGLHVVQTGPKPDNNGPRELKMLKTNLGRYESSLGFNFLEREEGGVVLKWEVEPPEKYKAPTKEEGCETWLLDLLEGGAVKPMDVVEMGKELGFSRSLIFRTREHLQAEIMNTTGRKSPDNCWALTGTIEAQNDLKI